MKSQGAGRHFVGRSRREMSANGRASSVESAALINVVTRQHRGVDSEIQLEELAGLAAAAGASVVLRATQERQAADPATLIGRGKADELALACDRAGANLVIFQNELSPAQARNLEQVFSRRIVDRTELILDIFARRARTREGRLQVELAQLEYLLPRLTGQGTALSRLGGGIGTRGPGETKLETDRRRIRHRVAGLKREIDEVHRRRRHLRARRRRTEVPTVALVGYTNAGKTTLFNRLTGGDAVTSDALFVTLDPLIRGVKFPDARRLMVSDTVGFIDHLPHQLVAAFHATLEEVTSADLLLHVIDAAESDRDRRVAAVRSVLTDIGAGRVPMLEVFNKIDLVSTAERQRLLAQHPGAACISARSGSGCRELLDTVAARVALDAERLSLEFDASREVDRRLVAELYRHARVVSHQARDGRVAIEADVPRRLLERFARAKVPA